MIESLDRSSQAGEEEEGVGVPLAVEAAGEAAALPHPHRGAQAQGAPEAGAQDPPHLLPLRAEQGVEGQPTAVEPPMVRGPLRCHNGEKLKHCEKQLQREELNKVCVFKRLLREQLKDLLEQQNRICGHIFIVVWDQI